MDFSTDKSSWILLILMMVIAYVINPWYGSDNVGMLLVQVIGFPLLVVALSSIPVLIYCYFVKMIPDIDYSIRLGFVYMLILLVMHFI